MHKTDLVGPQLWLSLLILALPTFAAEPPPIEAYGNLPAERDPVVSPDGHWIAWMDQREVKPRIVVFDVQNRKVQRIMAAPELVKLRGMVWSDSDTLLVTLSETKLSESQRHASREYFKIIAFDAAGGPTRMLPIDTSTSKPIGLEAQMLLTRSGTPHTAIMAIQMRDGNCLIAVDTHTGTWSVTKYGNQFTVGWVTDHRGNAVLREDWDWKTHTYRLLVLKKEPQKPVEILRRDDADAPKLMGLLPDGSAVMLLDTNGGAHQAAWALPLDGSPMKLLVEDPEADITAVYLDGDSGAPIGVYVSGSVTTVRWLEAPAQRRQEVLQRSFPDREVVLAGWTDGGNKALVQVQGPATPPTYYLVDFVTHRADIAAEEYPALTAIDLASTKEITYKARDGTEIPAYLTLPSKATGALPLIVLPHGGPNARDYAQFDWLVQFLASRGYVVLRPGLPRLIPRPLAVAAPLLSISKPLLPWRPALITTVCYEARLSVTAHFSFPAPPPRRLPSRTQTLHGSCSHTTAGPCSAKSWWGDSARRRYPSGNAAVPWLRRRTFRVRTQEVPAPDQRLDQR